MRFVILILNSRECGGEGEERGESDERLEGFRIFPKLICTCEHLKWRSEERRVGKECRP